MSNIDLVERHRIEHIETALEEKLLTGRGMGMAEALRVALEGLMANKMRSFLTMLGIIIGVSAVIVMVSLGQGVARATQAEIERLGTNVLTVFTTGQSRGGVNQGLGSQQILRLEMADVIRQSPSVKAVSAEHRGQGTVIYRNKNTRTTVYGATPEYFEMRNLPIAAGRAFNDHDVENRARVVVVGDNVRDTLFGRTDPVGKFMKINGQNFEVIGVTARRGAGGWRNPDDQVTIPVTTAMYRVFGADFLTGFSVQGKSASVMTQAQEEVTGTMNRLLRGPGGNEPEIRVFNQADLSESAAQQSRFLTTLLAGIALVSLIVGGIGIMNIMLVSVTERTREIGIRKAIGAKRKDILYQFLIESTTLSLVGGLIGVLFGIAVATWMALPADKGGLEFAILITLPPIIISFCFAAIVGIFFGIYPAIKASRLNPIEALRYE